MNSRSLSDYLPLGDRRAVRNAWLAYAMALVGVAAVVASGSKRSVVPAYRLAAQHWFAGENIYSGDGHGFIYLPQAAVLFGPFAVLPPVLGGILWRSRDGGDLCARRLSPGRSGAA